LRIDKSGRTSAGILLWRTRDGRLEVLLAHPGGPLWVNKDLGHWTIPKGETETAADELLAVACREFAAASTRDRHAHTSVPTGGTCGTDAILGVANPSVLRLAD